MPHTYNLPTRFSFVPSSGQWHVEHGFLILTFADLEVLKAAKNGKVLPYRAPLDAWEVRDRFLSLKRSEDDVLRFLNDTGRWDRSLGPHRLQNIWDWQDVINDLLLHPRKNLQDVVSQHLNPYVGAQGIAAYVDIDFEFSDQSVWFELTAIGCLGALIGTVLIDRSERARFKVCGRPDCHRTYRLESRHVRKYCSYDCAHLQSVRESRERKKIKQIRARKR